MTHKQDLIQHNGVHCVGPLHLKQQEPQSMEMFMEGSEMVNVSMQAEEMCALATITCYGMLHIYDCYMYLLSSM